MKYKFGDKVKIIDSTYCICDNVEPFFVIIQKIPLLAGESTETQTYLIAGVNKSGNSVSSTVLERDIQLFQE